MNGIEIEDKFIVLDYEGNITHPIPRIMWDEEIIFTDVEDEEYIPSYTTTKLGDWKIKEQGNKRYLVPVSFKPLIYLEKGSAYFFNGREWSELDGCIIDLDNYDDLGYIHLIISGEFFHSVSSRGNEDFFQTEVKDFKIYDDRYDFFRAMCQHRKTLEVEKVFVEVHA